MEHYGYIYKTTNIQNNKIYLGMHKSEVFDKNYFGSGILIKKSLQKYGKDAFIVELIEWANTREDLCKKEKYWIDYFHARDPNIGYNIAFGGDGGDIFHIKSIDDQNKIRSMISQKITGRKQTDEWIEKRKLYGERNPMFGKHHTQEAKDKIRQANLGENNPMYGIPSPNKGKPCSEETKDKIRQTKLGENNPNYGKVFTEKEKIKWSEMFSGRKNPRAIPCILFCVETNNITFFDYIKEALDSVSILQSQYYYRKKKDGIMISPKDNMHYKIIIYKGGETNE